MAFHSITDFDDFSFLAAFEDGFERVEADAAFFLLLAMTTEAGRFKKRLDVLGVSDVLLRGGSGEFGYVNRGHGGRNAEAENGGDK